MTRAAEVHYRLNVLLVPVLVACALLLVDSQHRARKLFIELERMQTRSRELDIQFKQLQLDQLRLAKASMIDQRARRDLGMGSASADRTMYLTIPPVATRRQTPPLAWATEAAPTAAGTTDAAHAANPAGPVSPVSPVSPANPANPARPANASIPAQAGNAAIPANPGSAANPATAASTASSVTAAGSGAAP
ncbi:MAG: cell division protein FtsL [Betaproteobacteria bacterium]